MYQSLQRTDQQTMYDRLKSEHAYKQDVLVPAKWVRFDNMAHVDGMHAKVRPFMYMWPNDVGEKALDTMCWSNGVLARKAEQNLSTKLSMPIRYYDYLAKAHPNLLNTNLNYLLSKTDGPLLVRSFRPDAPFLNVAGNPDGAGLVRSFLSNRYKQIDNLDVLGAVMSAIAKSGVDVECRSASVTEDNFYMDFVAKDVRHFPDLLEGYLDPRTGRRGDTGIVSGFSIRNSETGSSRFQIVPRAVILVCNNGMTSRRDVIARTHLGARITDTGIVWSDDTMRKELNLIVAQTHDAIGQFLSPQYLGRKVKELTEHRRPLDNPMHTVRNVSKALSFEQDELDQLMEYFFRSDDDTTTGVYHSLTALAQTLPVDRQYDLEEQAFDLVPRIKSFDFVPGSRN